MTNATAIYRLIHNKYHDVQHKRNISSYTNCSFSYTGRGAGGVSSIKRTTVLVDRYSHFDNQFCFSGQIVPSHLVNWQKR